MSIYATNHSEIDIEHVNISTRSNGWNEIGRWGGFSFELM